jgi:hypothetical protein
MVICRRAEAEGRVGRALKAYESDLASARSRAQAIGAETREKLNAAAEAERKTLEDQLSAKLRPGRENHRGNARNRHEQRPRHCAEAASAIVQRLTGVLPDGGAVNSAVDASLKG